MEHSSKSIYLTLKARGQSTGSGFSNVRQPIHKQDVLTGIVTVMLLELELVGTRFYKRYRMACLNSICAKDSRVLAAANPLVS